MTVSQLKNLFPEVTSEDFEYVLWEWTAYPMGDTKTVVRQFRSKVRSIKNNRIVCWFCANDSNFGHKSYCPDNRKK